MNRETVLAPREWRALRDAHAQEVTSRTADHLARRSRGEKHPVQDFLFTYYPFKPAKIAQWNPAPGTALAIETEDDRQYFSRRWYTVTNHARVDAAAWWEDRGRGAVFIRDLLRSTLGREAALGCFGLHEWAMVYKLKPGQQRHEDVPLRLSQEETDRVVENHRIRCTHFDAFRFFTPDARGLNTIQPTREGMLANEQPGCLHAGMDLYKWAMKLQPMVEGSIVLEAFDLATQLRTLDMEASPYDVRPWGYGVVAIETAAGKAEYMKRQKSLSEKANRLRHALIDSIDRAEELAQGAVSGTSR
ncbi:3-methyladenine DNA glycosylase [Brevibacterium ravenspurgense]|uniref:3-methyladenine DNA glycosylase n=1 Tax=Brevibacterium ravenspurgense TaxID=479117 RepID=A0A2I1IGP9_9MICO|nr:3-methyladenine DNA glycosylase [Brevibacterium ravenspurgense]PKY70304.1 3-methyladenine DNA glycosylase [Brevibacterium ravenspurgense]